ncbi:PHP domain-containing protein [Gayadomonas joobiniege]|uniref:PHP domain-containing protein n=1 Tax=Gayadomonas joobiniege TaxID=1234606 RepID=UPI000360656A|nr:PHP domain-containing protein [Gayadomonas joobiniege]
MSARFKIDLHSHTFCSDGELSPEELVLRAANKDVQVLAITDHDCIDALIPAADAIKKHKLALQLINGVEISTRWHGFEIHILGLNIAPDNAALTEALQQQIASRETRARKIAEKLARVLPELDGDALFEKISDMAKGDSISRVHFARYLLQEGYVNHIQKAFDKYLGRKGKTYVPPQWMSPEHAIELIHAAGGQAVLAHPTRYDLNNKWVRRLVTEFAQMRGDAIEVGLPRQNNNELIQLANYAKQANLSASQGSDFHRVGGHNELGQLLPLPELCQPIWHNWSFLTRG